MAGKQAVAKNGLGMVDGPCGTLEHSGVALVQRNMVSGERRLVAGAGYSQGNGGNGCFRMSVLLGKFLVGLADK